MIAVYIPLWAPAAFICVLCLLPGLPDELRRAIAGTRAAMRNRRERRVLDRLWDDKPRAVRASSRDSGVAATTTGGTDYYGDAA